ncbi:MAG: GNAT family N-acetyltransferase [Nitriliruptorales bacterium]
MEVERFGDPAAFENEVGEYLMANEAAHNLPLGIISVLQEEASPYADAGPILALVRDDGGGPVLVAVRTPPWNIVLSLAKDPAAVDALADDLAADAMDLPGVTGPVDLAERFARRWVAGRGGAWRRHLSMRIFAATSARHPDDVPGSMRWPTDADRDAVREWNCAFAREALGEELQEDRVERWMDRMLDPNERRGLVLWDVEGEVVSMAGYGGPTPNGIRVFAVYTPPELRRRGFATACTAALTQHLLDAGRHFCFLFTDRANPTSNAIYRWIGYRPVLDASEFRFEAASG